MTDQRSKRAARVLQLQAELAKLEEYRLFLMRRREAELNTSQTIALEASGDLALEGGGLAHMAVQRLRSCTRDAELVQKCCADQQDKVAVQKQREKTAERRFSALSEIHSRQSAARDQLEVQEATTHKLAASKKWQDWWS